jgi:hypothetical protein
MKVKWTLETGYVTRIPAFVVNVPDEDLEGLDEGQQEEIINAYIQDDFENNISWSRVDD